MKLVYGTVILLDLSASLHLYRVQLSTGALSPWVPALVGIAGADRQNHALSVGTQVALMMDDYEGLILGAVNCDAKPAVNQSDSANTTVYRDGAVIEYDALHSVLKAQLPAGATSIIDSPGGLTINGAITLNGDINQTGSIVSSGDHTASGISLSGHTHAGDSGGTTGAPQ